MSPSFDEHFMPGIKRSSSMPTIHEISKTHKDAFHIKRASVMDILSTVESPSHWRYFVHKDQKRQSYLQTLKVGPFIGG